jgi:hypothetical protein
VTDAKPVLHQISLIARDHDATLAFYRKLGVDIPANPPEELRHSKADLGGGIDLEFDNEKLAGVYNAAWRKAGGSSRALIGFSFPTRGLMSPVDPERRYWPPKDSPAS